MSKELYNGFEVAFCLISLYRYVIIQLLRKNQKEKPPKNLINVEITVVLTTGV